MNEISFIGSGAPLLRAIKFSIKNKINIHTIFLPKGDEIISPLKKINIIENNSLKIIQTKKESFPSVFSKNTLNFSGYVFSINNSFIINDDLIKKNLKFLNIHNGLIQEYRGIGELCVFSAYCNKEQEYGATIHKINPGEAVDSGEILVQKKFSAAGIISFEELMIKSIKNYEEVFQENLLNILKEDMYDQARKEPVSDLIHLYSNFNSWYKTPKEGAHSLGFFSEKYKKLNKLITEN